jgi:hypothetical protein
MSQGSEIEKSFQLKVELGNDAMQTRRDVAKVLRALADLIQTGKPDGKVRDRNGNPVGEWSFT